MNIRKTAAFLLAAVTGAALLTGCQTVKPLDITKNSGDESSANEVSETEQATTQPVETYPDYPISYPAIEQQDTGVVYEAENCSLNGLNTAADRKNFSGEGYVCGFSAEGTDSLDFIVEVPSNQHYDLSFCIASDQIVNCTVLLNDTEISRFETTKDGAFTIITLYGVFLVKGESGITLKAEDGNIDLDYLKISNNTTLSELSYDADGEPANEKAAQSARELLSFLSSNYGKYIITGQYVSDDSNSELDLIYRTTGKYPVIRFSALENAGDSFDDSFKSIDAAAQWYKNGGIVGLMWHWDAPGKKPSVYAKDTDFKLSDAVTDIDIAEMSQEEIRGLYGEGKISEQCYGLILDIDNMAGQLVSLKNKGVPVLWRPLHEASGDWFWWGASGTDAYKWLWQLMYTRMTDYFGLDNLIWVWNGQSAGTLVDRSTFDIASVDIYMDAEKDYGSRYEQFAALQKIIGTNKLIALSECSRLPDIDLSFRDNAVWSFFGLWYGDYLENSSGEYSPEYLPKDSFIRMYNSNGALTLDEYTAMKNEKKQSTGASGAVTTGTVTTMTTAAPAAE